MRAWFAPQLLALHLFAVVAIAACVAGGLWQYSSYSATQDNQRVAAAAPVPLSTVWSADEPLTASLVNRRVTFSGTFADRSKQFWVRQNDGAWLVAPVRVERSDAYLLVVRGRADQPGALPSVPDQPVDLAVTLRPSDASLGPIDADRAVGSISVPALLNELSVPLWNGYGIASTETGLDLPLVDAPQPDVSWTVGLRNLAYSVQWWVFGAFALFMWWRMSRDVVAKVQE